MFENILLGIGFSIAVRVAFDFAAEFCVFLSSKDQP